MNGNGSSSSSNTSVLLDSPKSIFGFEPISGGFGQPGGTRLMTQRSLLQELLQASAEGPELAEHDDYTEDDCGERISVPPLRPCRCTCNVGQAVPLEFHARECALATEFPLAKAVNGAEVGIDIPNKTYYKSARQIEERARLLHQRRMYRKQEEALGYGRA